VPALRSLFLPLTLFLPVILLIGCQEEGIETHRVPRVDSPEPKVRLLGAIIPHENDTWFVKLVGPLDAIAAEKDSFDTFLASLRFKDDAKEPLTWTLPAGWKTGEGKTGRYATLHVGKGAGDKPMELTIFKFGKEPEARSVTANVNRWRKNDLGLRGVGAAEIPDLVTEKPIGADKVPATLVDMVGPGGTGGMRPPGNVDLPGIPGEKPTLKYDTPPGWEAAPTKGRIIPTEAAFTIREGERSAEVTVTVLAQSDTVSNINRWRDQVGLRKQTEDEVKKDVKTLTVAGATAVYADLVAPGDDAGRKRILGVMLNRKGSSWFFKMTGPADLVGKNKDAFEKFVGSVKFEGGNDG
jgi:hypothetical protein